MKLKERILPYYQAIPKLLLFQFVSGICIFLINLVTSMLSGVLLGLSGKTSVSSGDLMFLFTRWQGYALILIGLLTVLAYIAIELNALILYCGKLINGENPSVWSCIKEGFAAFRKYLNPRGPVIVLYAAIISPLIGLGFSISLTESFYIPRFIMSVINANTFYRYGYLALQIALFVIAVIYSFILHGVLLDGMKMKEASVQSRRLFFRHWKNFLWELVKFFVIAVVIAGLCIGLFCILPLFIVQLIPMGESALMFCDIFFGLVGVFCVLLIMLLSLSFLIIKLTMLYKKYSSDEAWRYQKREKKKHPFVIAAAVLVLAAITAISVGGTIRYDVIFPTEIKPGIVAHRAGGVEAPENTVKGVETAYELGASGSEIDIQRTADGYYVVNHDDTFERVAGVNKKPSEMTLEDVRKLRVDGEPVPTLEEMLDASRDKVTLFVELKGETADNQMADDAVKIIKQKGMEDQVVLISLKYDVLEYIEQKYPEMLTGYLAFISFGQIEETPFDYLALEEEISTDDNVSSIHKKGKKMLVWTVNEEDDLEHFLLSDADAIITDSVKLSGKVREDLEARAPLQVIYQYFADRFV